jgi:hypothetical protein
VRLKAAPALVTTAVEFESAVNALQAELDEMRVQGRRLLRSGWPLVILRLRSPS